LKNPCNCVLASLKPLTYLAVRLGLSLAAALLQSFLELLQLFVRQLGVREGGSGIIEVGQISCQ